MQWPFQRRAPIGCPLLLPGHLSITQSRRNGVKGQRSLSHPGAAQRPDSCEPAGTVPGALAHRKPDAHRAPAAVGPGQAGALTPGLPQPPQMRWLLASDLPSDGPLRLLAAARQMPGCHEVRILPIRNGLSLASSRRPSVTERPVSRALFCAVVLLASTLRWMGRAGEVCVPGPATSYRVV